MPFATDLELFHLWCNGFSQLIRKLSISDATVKVFYDKIGKNIRKIFKYLKGNTLWLCWLRSVKNSIRKRQFKKDDFVNYIFVHFKNARMSIYFVIVFKTGSIRNSFQIEIVHRSQLLRCFLYTQNSHWMYQQFSCIRFFYLAIF